MLLVESVAADNAAFLLLRCDLGVFVNLEVFRQGGVSVHRSLGVSLFRSQLHDLPGVPGHGLYEVEIEGIVEFDVDDAGVGIRLLSLLVDCRGERLCTISIRLWDVY